MSQKIIYTEWKCIHCNVCNQYYKRIINNLPLDEKQHDDLVDNCPTEALEYEDLDFHIPYPGGEDE